METVCLDGCTWAQDSVSTSVLMPNVARLVGVRSGPDLQSVVPSGEEEVGLEPDQLFQGEVVARDVSDLAEAGQILARYRLADRTVALHPEVTDHAGFEAQGQHVLGGVDVVGDRPGGGLGVGDRNPAAGDGHRVVGRGRPGRGCRSSKDRERPTGNEKGSGRARRTGARRDGWGRQRNGKVSSRLRELGGSDLMATERRTVSDGSSGDEVRRPSLGVLRRRGRRRRRRGGPSRR